LVQYKIYCFFQRETRYKKICFVVISRFLYLIFSLKLHINQNRLTKYYPDISLKKIQLLLNTRDFFKFFSGAKDASAEKMAQCVMLHCTSVWHKWPKWWSAIECKFYGWSLEEGIRWSLEKKKYTWYKVYIKVIKYQKEWCLMVSGGDVRVCQMVSGGVQQTWKKIRLYNQR
jgi:hypothetical protein